MASIDLVLSAFLLLTFVAAAISIKLKTPYTLVLVLAGALIVVVVGLQNQTADSVGGNDV